MSRLLGHPVHLGYLLLENIQIKELKLSIILKSTLLSNKESSAQEQQPLPQAIKYKSKQLHECKNHLALLLFLYQEHINGNNRL
jgi:hypothetical protein